MLFRLKVILLTFYLILFSQNVVGQNLSVGQFDLTSQDGLPSSEMSFGFQASSGFIWIIPAADGLCRYDGISVKKYGKECGVTENHIYDAFEDDQGMIWILSGLLGQKTKNVDLFDPLTEKAVSLKTYFKQKILFSERDIISIKQNFDGSIWMLLLDGSIYEYDQRQIRFWGTTSARVSDQLQKHSKEIICSLEDNYPNKRINYSTPSGTVIKSYTLKNTLEASFIDPVQTNQAELEHIFLRRTPLNSNYKLHLRSSIGEKPIVLDSTTDLSHGFLLGDGRHYYKIKGNTVRAFDVSMNFLFEIKKGEGETFLFGDSQNGFWMTTGRAHLRRYFTFQTLFTPIQYAMYDQPWYREARGIARGINNDLYIAQGGAILHLDADGTHSFMSNLNAFEKTPDFFGLRVQRDKSYLWICAGSRIKKYNLHSNTLEKTYYLKNELFFWQTYEDRHGTIWLGNANGLYYIDREKDQIKQFESPAKFGKLNKCSVYDFYENEQGLWIATSSGLFLVNERNQVTANYSKFKKNQYFIPTANIKHIQQDEDGTFWLATGGDGLIHWNSKTNKSEQFTTNDGLSDNTIYACYLDKYGQVWLPSNNGLMRFDKRSKKTIHFTELDGITHLEFNTISHFKDANGRLYFGGLNGVISLQPKDFVPNKQNYPFRLVSIERQNDDEKVTTISVTKRKKQYLIEISPNDKTITLSFAFLNYKKPKTHKYEYKIEGYDKHWQPLESPKLQLSRLPYGEYSLRVRVQASGCEWQEFSTPIQLIVLKPFYLQWWFFLLCFSMFALIVIVFIRWRVSRLVQRKKELEIIVKERTSEIQKQAEELKSLDKMKSQFFANISHELRTPVTLILGPLALLKSERLSSLKESHLTSNLNVIERNAKKLLGLIEEVLELSKLNAGKINLKNEPTFLKPFVKQIKVSFDGMAQMNNINYRIEFEPSKDLCVMLDQKKLEKVLNNLLLNAFKFTQANGKILLRVEEFNDTIRVSVKDSGIGIEKVDLPRVFERFYQSKASGMSTHGGTGIGLAICFEMIRLMKGKIWVESEVGLGSSFQFEIPKIISDEKSKPESAALHSLEEKLNIKTNTAAAHKKTILIVEDNEDLRVFIRSLLESKYNTITANNGAEAISFLQKFNAPDLIISDVMMPIMDGFELLEVIKENDAWRSLPVMMLTARAAEEDKLFALTLGVDDYLLKPFSNQELLIRTENLLRNYQNRTLWKQEVFSAVKTIQKPDSKDLKQKTEVSITKKDLAWMTQLEEKIKQGFINDEFNILSLADQMFLSRRQFERRIKKITGLSPAKLVMEVRLQKARELLENEHFTTVSEVSYAVGLQTPHYFSTLYAKRFGKKPSEYFS